jgi:hypothetical protein
MIRKFFTRLGLRRRLIVELKPLAYDEVYVYEDERLRFQTRVPHIKVFLAFVRELDRLGAEGDEAEAQVTVLARAFWVLSQRPKRKGFIKKRCVMPEVDEEAALGLYRAKFPRAKVAAASLAAALFGLVEFVTRDENERSSNTE